MPPRPPLLPLLFSHDLEVISSQSNCVSICVQKMLHKSYLHKGRKQLGEQEIQWGSVLDPLMSSTESPIKSNKVQSIQLLMSLKRTSQTHIIEIDKDVTYVYLSYYNTFMKQKKSLIIPPSEKNTVDYPKKSRLSQVDYLHILTKDFIIINPKSRKILPR